jgi:hypothetical protein
LSSLDEKRALIRDFYMIAETLSSKADAEIVRGFAQEIEHQICKRGSRSKAGAPRT